jgi:glyoxylase-like metal-dependent hydrolase (beta-lactamase superfamily II)
MPSDFYQLSKNLWVKQNNPYATNTGLLINAGQVCLIDPGISPADCEEIISFVAKYGAEVTTVILTHAHWDHLLGAQYFPKAQVVANRCYLDVIHKHSVHLAQQVFVWWTSVNNDAFDSWTPPNPSTVFMHSMEMRIGELSIRLLHTPGHTIDHSVVYLPQEKMLWAGDMLSDRDVPLVEDINAYIKSLAMLDEMETNILVSGHGTPALQSGEIQTRFDQDRDYVYALRQCVQHALVRGDDSMLAVNNCIKVPFAQPDEYPNALRWNIESAYRRLGGSSTDLSGWDNEWHTIAK